MSNPQESPKPARKGKVHSFGEALEGKVARASRSLGFEPTNDVTPEVQVAQGESLLWIDGDLIDDNPFQPRTDYPNTDQLKLIRTMNDDGQLMPIGVRPHPTAKGRYQARFGHRRKYAVTAGAVITDETGEERRVYANAGVRQPNPSSFIGKVWCVVREANDLELRRQAWQENEARLAIPVMDQARFFVATREALSAGKTKPVSWRATADFLGEKDHVYVYRIGSLLELPDAMRAALEVGPNGEKPLLNERHGRALLMLHTPDGAESHAKAQRELFREIKKELLSGAEAERRAKERRQFLADKTPSKEDKQLFEHQREEQKSAPREAGNSPTLRSVEMPAQGNAPSASTTVPAETETETETTEEESPMWTKFRQMEEDTSALIEKLKSVAAPPPADEEQRKLRAVGALETALSNVMFARECIELLDESAKTEIRAQLAMTLELLDENNDIIRESANCWGIES